MQLKFIILCSMFFISSAVSASTDVNAKSTESTQTPAKVSSGDVNSAELPFETSHKIHRVEDFRTSHRISDEALKRRDDLHYTMRSKEKPELDESLGELIAADIKNNIEAKRLSEYERYVVEPLTATTTPEPSVLTTMSPVAVNEGLIDVDDLTMLEEAGSENKQTSRIQIKKGPNGQEYEYEYVYYYYDDDEKNPGDDDVIIGTSKKGTPTTAEPSVQSTSSGTQQQSSGGKSRYSSIERGNTATERNEIQSSGKARSQSLPPAPVQEEEVGDERLPQVTRFPQRAKSVDSSISESSSSSAGSGGKRQHVKRPGLDLVDSHSFSNEKSSKSQGPRIIETEHTKSEVFESVSKSSVEYVSSTTSSSVDEDEEDTTPLVMEKLAIDLYAILANENAKEDDKKSRLEYEVVNSSPSTTSNDDEQTTIEFNEPKSTSTTARPTTTSTTTTTTTTTPAPKTTTTTVTTTTTEAPRGRGALTAGRNRFRLQPKSPSSTDSSPAEASTEAPKNKNRFSRPSSSSSSFSSRSSGSRASKPSTTTTSSPSSSSSSSDAKADKNEFSTKSLSKNGASRNRFSPRNQQPSTTEKSADAESSTASRLLTKQRPQFSLRNRGRNAAAPSSTTEANDENDNNNSGEVEAATKDSSSGSSSSTLLPRPTSRLNLARPIGGRGGALPGQKARTSPLTSRRGSSGTNSNDETGDSHKSDNENESETETTTQNNLNKLKNRPRIQINSDAAKTKKAPSSSPVINRKVNPLISKRKFGVTSTTEPTAEDDNSEEVSDKEGTNESEVEVKEEETTPAAAEVTSETPRGLGGLLNRRKLATRRPGTI